MTNDRGIPKALRPYLRTARKHGARVEHARSGHVKIFTSTGRLVMVVSAAKGRDTKMVETVWRREGWT